ncbi:MAG TPA: SLBB domain-containing protein [Sandaracinaceae bacterium LLY-WYZ-13_1]|nr:SLBB domain-containing protein [Sandaracinaceae bacterium LLY-WYZ-13_1]
MKTVAFRLALTLSLALPGMLLAPGCGGLPRAPAHPSDDGGFRAVGVTPPEGMDPGQPSPMMLVPGDVVTLRTISATTEEVEGLTVDARGMLHVPLAGDVEVGGLPLEQAEERIEQAMRQYDRTMRATIIVSDAAGHTASVIGAVGEQGQVRVAPGMRVAELLAAAGGALLSDEDGTSSLTADLSSARLVREGEVLPISLQQAVEGDPRHNVYVRPGDHLYVPPQLEQLVSVIGEVNGARVMSFQPGLRLSQALAMAGGVTRDANGGDIRIVRGGLENPRVYRAAIDHIVAGEHPDPIIAPGDIIHVGSSALADFRDAIAAIAPLISIAATASIGATTIAVASPD